jgi:hypothetical protein
MYWSVQIRKNQFFFTGWSETLTDLRKRRRFAAIQEPAAAADTHSDKRHCR